ncbi:MULTISPECIES: electron transport complex subunit RsxC [Eubacterium]|uniref:electron transport complex subunit RsxC n=1 Tax=Eubacterium TaxID=1730 RepID=UPI001568E759|nr:MULTISPECIES: electron transport complex subunit RsxC [Eubacterium]MCR5367342.1 electron transport complex subunit RsxC [Eubacterium sp.]
MAIFTFKGGIHPYGGKKLSNYKEIKVYVPKGEIVLPLSQHIGAPAKPIVEKGDKVVAGQKIAEAAGFVSANVHSTVSGTVKAIEKRLTPGGNKVDSIIIDNDHFFEEMDYSQNIKNLETLYREDVIDIIKEAGIVGMGGAGFPTHVKLSPKNEADIDTIIVNGAECEPYITSDYRRMIEEPMKLILGLQIVVNLFNRARGIIAVEDNKPEAIKILKEMTKDLPNITVRQLKTKYPQGAERQLIYASTGRFVNSKMLPADAGVIVNNVDTIISIYEAVIEGRPLISRVVTVSGDAIAEPGNFIVPLGTSYRELIEAAGGYKVEPEKVISGGPMMGRAIFSLDIPITKGTSSILALSKDEVAELEPSSCIKCGRCVSICPGRVMPNILADYAEHGRYEKFLDAGGMECCECGCCSYVCPAKRHLTQTIAGTRKALLANKKK